jgi:hypothetical protein
MIETSVAPSITGQKNAFRGKIFPTFFAWYFRALSALENECVSERLMDSRAMLFLASTVRC